MSIASNARASAIAHNVESGKYVKNSKFQSFGSVVEDSIFAQQKEAERRLAQIQAQRGTRRVKA